MKIFLKISLKFDVNHETSHHTLRVYHTDPDFDYDNEIARLILDEDMMLLLNNIDFKLLEQTIIAYKIVQILEIDLKNLAILFKDNEHLLKDTFEITRILVPKLK